MTHQPSRLQIVLCALVGLYSLTLHGLESDTQQRIQFSADGGSKMSTRGEIQVLEMETNVRISQGTLQILGDSATFERNAASNALVRITMKGTPVQYQQQLNSGGIVTGTSETLMMYPDPLTGENVIELVGNANISTPDSSMKCASIVYLAEQSFIRDAFGPCEGVFNSQSN